MLTVVFAPSGVGKTSLFRTLVTPGLRALEARVVYHDNWTPEPLPTLRAAVHRELNPAQGPEAPSLIDLAQFANGHFDESLVLVLDQFEQVLLRHAGRTDGLASELGSLMRSGVDAHVVIVLREEHLALLHSLRGHWLTVTASRYRLGPLDEAGARCAIELPLLRFDGRVEPELVDELLRALALGSVSAGAGDDVNPTRGISLPLLQIVCSRLWQAVGQTPERAMTMERYRRDGKCNGVVDAYVRDVLAGVLPDDRLDIARMLNLLAPKAGVKMAYPIELLADQLAVSMPWLLTQLAHFEKHRIVQIREGGRIAELTHDAFTEVLRGFIDGEVQSHRAQQLAHDLIVRRRRNFVRAFFALALAGSCIFLIGDWVREPSVQRRALEAGKCRQLQAPIRYFRDRIDREASLEEKLLTGFSAPPLPDLVEGLRANPAATTCTGARAFRWRPRTGMESSISLVFRPPSDSDGSPKLNPDNLRRLWVRLAEELSATRQRRVPSRVNVAFDEAVLAGTFVLQVEKRSLFTLKVPPMERSAARIGVLIRNAPASIDNELKSLSEAFDFAPHPVRGLDERRARLGLADAWSAPVWQAVEDRLEGAASGEAPFSVEASWSAFEMLVTTQALERLLEQPESYITAALTNELLALRQKQNPCLVASAAHLEVCRTASAVALRSSPSDSYDECRRAAGQRLGSRVQQTLIEAAYRGRSAGVLTRVLDRMADLDANAPEAEPQRIAQWLLSDEADTSSLPLGMIGAVQRSCPRVLESAGTSDATASRLDDDERAIHLELSPDLYERLMQRPATDRPGENGLSELRLQLYLSNGILAPEITPERVDAHGFKVTVLGAEPAWHSADRNQPLGEPVAELLRATPALWITADAEWPLPGRLREWIEQRWSRNDIKQLLRAGWTRTAADPSGQPAAHDAAWLLGSLPIWSAVCEARDGPCLAARLRETREARLLAARTGSIDPATSTIVAALLDDQPDQARLAFERARLENPEQAAPAFQNAYATSAREALLRRAQAACAVPPATEPWARLGENELLQARAALALLGSEDQVRRSQLEFCVAARSVPSNDPQRDARELGKLADGMAANAAPWSAEQTLWVVYHLQQAHQRASAQNRRTPVPEATRALLSGLLTRALDHSAPADADAAVKRLLERYQTHPDPAGLWDLAQTARGADLSPATFEQLAAALSSLATDGGSERIQLVKELSSRADAGSPARSAALALEQLSLDVDLLAYGRGDPVNLARSFERSSKRFDDPRVERSLQRRARALYRTILDYAGRSAEADVIAAELEATALPYTSEQLDAASLMLQQGRVSDAARTVDALLDRGSEGPRAARESDALFVSTLAHLLLDDDVSRRRGERLLLWVDHPEEDDVRLMLAWRLRQRGQESRARELLEQRLLEIGSDDSSEPQRPDDDLSQWRRMLLGYALDPSAERREKLFALLENEEASERSPLVKEPRSFSGRRCEALFHDALLQSVTGEPSTRQERHIEQLRAVTRDRCRSPYERPIARWLIARSDPPRASAQAGQP